MKKTLGGRLMQGYLLGTFDPIHTGHLQMIHHALTKGGCDKVVVIPTRQNPWKEKQPASYEDRCQMIKNAILPFGDKCELSYSEMELEPPFYSYKTLERYRADGGVIICGTDVAEKIHEWKNYETGIKPYFGVLVIPRGENDISSTRIRELIKNGQEIYPLVPETVREYITIKKLYNG